MKYTSTILVAVAFLIAATYAEDPWTPSPLCPFPSEEQIRFPYEGDCSKYWECYEGARYPMSCPEGLEYNAQESRCDHPTIANCDPDATISYPTFSHSTQSTPSTVPTQDPGPLPECPFPSNELVFFPVVNNCSQYWECFQGHRYLMSCPAGLNWNTLFNYCDYPGNVDCSLNSATTTSPGNNITTTTPVTTTTTGGSTGWTPDPQCPYPSDEIHFFPHPTNCSLYYECYLGIKYLLSCPDGLVWNEQVNNCDYAEHVDCNRNITTTTASPTQATTPNTICADQPDGTYLPHPTDCNKFYECVGGKAIEEECPGDLVWNPQAHTCDYSWNVDCTNGKRKFP